MFGEKKTSSSNVSVSKIIYLLSIVQVTYKEEKSSSGANPKYLATNQSPMFGKCTKSTNVRILQYYHKGNKIFVQYAILPLIAEALG